MADNTTYTPGAGETLAMDDIGGVKHQRVKISVGADGSATDWTGLVGTADIVVTVIPTIQAAAYAGGDLIFDSTEIANAARVSGYCTTLQSVTILDKGDQKVPFTLVFANAATDFGTLNSAPDPDDTEAETVIGHVAVLEADYLDLGANAVACIRNIGLQMQPTGTSVWVAGINGSLAPTYASVGDLVIRFGFMRS